MSRRIQKKREACNPEEEKKRQKKKETKFLREKDAPNKKKGCDMNGHIYHLRHGASTVWRPELETLRMSR